MLGKKSLGPQLFTYHLESGRLVCFRSRACTQLARLWTYAAILDEGEEFAVAAENLVATLLSPTLLVVPTGEYILLSLIEEDAIGAVVYLRLEVGVDFDRSLVLVGNGALGCESLISVRNRLLT